MRYSILSALIVCGGLGCGQAFETAPGTGGGGAGTTGAGGSLDDAAGCADGERELFRERSDSPNVAGCQGAFSIPGVTSADSKAPSCGRAAGNDGENRAGTGCSVADLCAVGWHVCSSVADIDVACDTDAKDTPAFFVSRVSTAPGSLRCAADGNDNLVGCGVDVGQSPDGESCGPLNAVLIFSQCDTELDEWDCGTSTDLEAQVVTKPGDKQGGALCCRDR